MKLTHEISDFGALVGLLLALATLLTANRATAVSALYKTSGLTSSAKLREVALNALLGCVTLLVWLAGLPLAVDAVENLRPLANGGPLRSVFVLTWVLLLGLIGWQATLTARAGRVRLPPP